MATLSRLAFAFGAPAIVMATVIGVVWLATSRVQTGLGPSRPVLFIPPSELAMPTGARPPLPPSKIDEPGLAWQAQARNALIPFSRASRLAPARFLAAADAEAPAQALQCLTSAIYYEAADEPDAGKRAVAQVVVNRWANPAFPKTICGVVDQGAPAPGCQFSFMCDGALARRPAPERWRQAEAIARAALHGYVEASVGAATHYHADYVVPVWAATMLKLTRLGRHIFYRWPGAAAYATVHMAGHTESAPAGSPGRPGVASAVLTAPAPDPAPPAPAPALRSSPPDETPRRDPAPVLPSTTPRPQSPTPERPRRPVPPPSLRVGPV
jgi:hypothetical protein